MPTTPPRTVDTSILQKDSVAQPVPLPGTTQVHVISHLCSAGSLLNPWVALPHAKLPSPRLGFEWNNLPLPRITPHTAAHAPSMHRFMLYYTNSLIQVFTISKTSWKGRVNPPFAPGTSISGRWVPRFTPFFLECMSHMYPLTYPIAVPSVWGGLCHSNFERDIVDTCCHASRNLATIGPNRPLFLLYEGKVWKDRHETSVMLDSVWLSRC